MPVRWRVSKPLVVGHAEAIIQRAWWTGDDPGRDGRHRDRPAAATTELADGVQRAETVRRPVRVGEGVVEAVDTLVVAVRG